MQQIPESPEVLAHSDRRDLHGRAVAVAFIVGAWLVAALAVIAVLVVLLLR